MVNWKHVSRCDEQMKTTYLIRPRSDVSKHNRDRMVTFETHLKIHEKWQQNAIFRGIVPKYTNWFLCVLHVEVDRFRLQLQSCHYGNSQCGDKSVMQLSYPCDAVMG